MRTLTKEWFKLSDYDLKSAEVMLKGCRYLYVAFLCQQAMEKLMKGIRHEQTGETPPYTHRLMALAELIGFDLSQDQRDFLNLLSRYYIKTRYPEDKEKLSKDLNKKKATELFQKTREYCLWLKKELKT